jgi:hypothetical protein
MDHLACCKDSSWVAKRDLGHAEGFEYSLGKCGRCGARWMSVFCVASGVAAYEQVTSPDVDTIQSMKDGPALKAFLRRWGDENL